MDYETCVTLAVCECGHVREDHEETPFMHTGDCQLCPCIGYCYFRFAESYGRLYGPMIRNIGKEFNDAD